VCERERERESVCVCVLRARERRVGGRKRERACARTRVWKCVTQHFKNCHHAYYTLYNTRHTRHTTHTHTHTHAAETQNKVPVIEADNLKNKK